MSCERYETEGLTGFAPTPDFATHLMGCAACQNAQSLYARLERLLSVAGSRAMPPTGWETRLQQRLKNPRASERTFPTRTIAVAASLLAATLVVFVLKGRSGVVADASIESEVLSGGNTRSINASVGDRYQITVPKGREVRVWFNGSTLVARCPGADAVCSTVGDKTRVTVPLKEAGEYRAMMLQPGGEGLAEPAGFDEDVRLAGLRHATPEVLEPLVVY